MLARDTAISETAIRALIADIKSKKELRSLNDEFVREQIYQYLNGHPLAAALLTRKHNPKSSHYKKIIKEVRASLRKVYGLFRTQEQELKRKELLDEMLASVAQLQTISKKILDTHSSTRERLPFYEKLYAKIFKITGKPATILDVGCGINPFSIPLMNLSPLHYYAYDLSDDEIETLNHFFDYLHKKNSSFTGKADILDVLQWAKLSTLGSADLCFLFKMTDVLDRGKGHKVTEIVIAKVPARYVVVSFPTHTMSGKKMRVPQRNWMQWMCTRLGYSFKVLEFPTEIFYVVKKKNNLL
ncbi:MAG TPA: hypothetical protein VJI32_03190 [Candidatus Nanoarchaeia archaeon]|nr:hypothetical protein [Candidatus Nanoarchaeia archaeon]